MMDGKHLQTCKRIEYSHLTAESHVLRIHESPRANQRRKKAFSERHIRGNCDHLFGNKYGLKNLKNFRPNFDSAHEATPS